MARGGWESGIEQRSTGPRDVHGLKIQAAPWTHGCWEKLNIQLRPRFLNIQLSPSTTADGPC